MYGHKTLILNQRVQPVGLALCAVLSFLSAGAEIGGVASPLAAAAAGALPPVYALAVLAGGLFACFAAGLEASAAVVLCALVIVALGRCLLGEAIRPQHAALTVGAGIFFAALVFFVLGTQDLAALVLYLFLGVFSGVCTYFLAAVRGLWQRGEPLRMDGEHGLAFCVVYLLLIAALSPVSVFFLQPGLLVGAFAILTAAERYRAAGGMLSGVLTTAGLLLCTPSLGAHGALLGLSGLAAGYFAELGNAAVLGIFLATNSVGQLLLGMDSDAYLLLGNLAISGLLFLALPTQRLADAVLPERTMPADSTAFAAVRMSFLADSLGGVRRNAEQIARMLERSNAVQAGCTAVCEEICGHCPRKVPCWGDRYDDTNGAFARLAKDVPDSAEALLALLPGCVRAEALRGAFARNAKQRAVGRVRTAQLLETRQLLFSQMRLTEDILATAGQRLALRFCAEQSRAVGQALERGGYCFHTAMAYYSPAHRLTIELYGAADGGVSAEEIRTYLEETLGRQLACAEAVTAGQEVRLCLWERPPFSLLCASAQSPAHAGQPTGDSFAQFTDELGNTYLALSDGMGSGRQAALDSRIVLANFRRLIEMGVAWQTALTMVNTIMLTKSGEERFATLDAVRLDGESGEATLVKSGGSSTLIWHDGQLVQYQSPTCPIGILARTEPFVKTVPLSDGDIVILLSDGVDPSLYPAFKQILLAGGDLSDAAQRLCALAQRIGEAAPDDVTVLLAAIRCAEDAPE